MIWYEIDYNFPQGKTFDKSIQIVCSKGFYL